MGRKINVLLADNSEYFAIPCANVMKSHGLDVTMSEKDGQAVVEAITRQLPDVVLMDLFLPRLDAIGVLHRLEQQGLSHRPQFMIMSSFDNPALEREAMSAGADYYFLKPFDAGEMAKRILSLCGEHSPMERRHTAAPDSQRGSL